VGSWQASRSRIAPLGGKIHVPQDIDAAATSKDRLPPTASGQVVVTKGFADALQQEVAGFGIHVTSNEPGGFRTDLAGRSMQRVQRSIADYDARFDPIRENH
jgi:hypothetical protein